jgi:hypothetical protein
LPKEKYRQQAESESQNFMIHNVVGRNEFVWKIEFVWINVKNFGELAQRKYALHKENMLCTRKICLAQRKCPLHRENMLCTDKIRSAQAKYALHSLKKHLTLK